SAGVHHPSEWAMNKSALCRVVSVEVGKAKPTSIEHASVVDIGQVLYTGEVGWAAVGISVDRASPGLRALGRQVCGGGQGNGETSPTGPERASISASGIDFPAQGT